MIFWILLSIIISYLISKIRKFMDSKSMKLIASGSGSQIYHYSNKDGDYALKFVPGNCPK